MSNLTVKALKTETGVTDYQLKQKCQDEHLRKISQHVGNRHDFAAKFGLLPALIAGIQIDPSLSFAQKTQKVLMWWRDNNDNATYLKFVQVCLELGNGSVASKMCEICKEGVKDLPFPEATTLGTEVKEIPPASTLPKTEGMQMFCTTDDEKVEQVDPADASNIPTDAQGGVARYHLLWDVKQVPELKVHFLNPEILMKDNWTCGHSHDQLTANNVLDWATVWNNRADNYPQIADELATRETAHIRVEFTSDKKVISWSKVGSAALNAGQNNPTMVLNLYGMEKAEQRSMVIHEFGHALGLDHEHQRSDFWDVLESKDEYEEYRFIIGRRRMKSGDGGHCMRACDAVFRGKLNLPHESEKSDYDPASIMHYWFDKNWLLPEYRKRSGVVNVRDERERKVLLGVHDRDYHNGNLAKQPSRLDYETLNKAYSNKASSCRSCAGRSQCNGKSCPCFHEEKACTPKCHCKLDSCRNPNNGSHDGQKVLQTGAAAGPPTTTQYTKPEDQTEATAAQLSKECSNDALLQLSTEIADYDGFKFRLGLSDAEINGIDRTIVDIPGRFYAALRKWKSKGIFNSTATYGRLVEIARKKEDGDAFRSIHKACIEHASP